MSKHTPGPWTTSYSMDGLTVDSAKPVRINQTTAGTVVVARVIHHHDAEHFSAEANARLIAASPDLLQALQLVAAHIPEIIASGILTAAETDTIRAAITKAGD